MKEKMQNLNSEEVKIEYCPDCNKMILETDALYCSNCGFNLIKKEEKISKYEVIFNTLVNIPLILMIIYLILLIIGIVPDFYLGLKIGAVLLFLLIICYLVGFGVLCIGKFKCPHNHKIRKKFKSNAIFISFFLPTLFVIIEICYSLVIN